MTDTPDRPAAVPSPDTPDRTGSDDLTHLRRDGSPRMVDVSEKEVTARRAVAVGQIRMQSETFAAVRDGNLKKGSVVQVAQLAGVMAGKRTAELIPLCHMLPGASVDIAVDLMEELPGVRVTATATIAGQTGVEMEALTAASVALLTVYDMAKAIDRGMVIEEVRLVRKEGGKSGVWEGERLPD